MLNKILLGSLAFILFNACGKTSCLECSGAISTVDISLCEEDFQAYKNEVGYDDSLSWNTFVKGQTEQFKIHGGDCNYRDLEGF
jgi:hypothetical protein